MRAAVALAVVLASLPVPARADGDLARYVDPMIGTFGAGFVFPGPAAPFGMVQLSPDTDGYFAYTGYLWSDANIRGFSHVHVESMGVHEGGDIPFMPTVGPVRTHPNDFKSPFEHASEHAEAGYYRVTLARYGTVAELTAGLRVGMHHYTFPAAPQANVLIDAGHSAAGTDVDPANGLVSPGSHVASVEIVAPDTIVGTSHSSQGYTVHFASRFDRPFASFGTWASTGAAPSEGSASVEGDGAGAYVTFDTLTDRDVLIKTGISFVDRAGAIANLQDELPDGDFGFDALRARTRAAWNEALRAIEVTGGTEAELRSFYTALYHAQHHPNVFEDADGRYIGHDDQVHSSDGYTHYANFSLWDTYRTQMPLLAVIRPDRYSDMMHTLLQMYRQTGRFPQWALMNRYPDYMIGEPVLPALADGFCRGLVHPDDADELYADAVAQALHHPRDVSRFTYGYVPHDVDDGGASVTLEHAIAAFSLALVADARGDTTNRDALLEVAAQFRNVVDQSMGFVRPRMRDGSWMPDYHPEMPDGFVEGTGWQYTWLAPHDVAGLVDALGGTDAVREKLAVFFALPAELQKHLSVFGIAYYGNQYSPANEHDLQAPWLFNSVGQPSRTQEVIADNRLLYRPTPDGLPGNDDLGTMSAWFIWSALGMYPLAAGAPMYVLTSPLFDTARIGGFTVRADGPGGYIGSATLHGVPLDRTWITHDALRDGGELAFAMSPVPTSWAADAPPPSMSTDGPGSFGCGA